MRGLFGQGQGDGDVGRGLLTGDGGGDTGILQAGADMKTLYIDDLCVDEDCRGQGIGRKMYEYVRSYAKDTGCYHITLNVWEMNPRARKFYESIGMKPLKTYMEDVL